MKTKKKITLLVIGAVLAIILVLCLFQFWPGISNTTPQRPNIVLLTVNVLRADHVSSYGYSRITTPAIDVLAKESYVFKNAFAHAGYTMPSMMSIMTSLYPQSHQVYDAFKDELSSKVLTLAEILKIHDYQTGWFAKLNLGHLLPKAGFGRGFTFKSDLGLQMEGKKNVIGWIDKVNKGPFFLAMNVRHAHSPYLPLQKYRHAFSKDIEKFPIETYEDFTKTVYEKFIDKINDPNSLVYQIIDPEVVASRQDLFAGGYQKTKLEQIDSLIKTADHHRMGGFQMDTYFETIDYSNEENIKAMIAYYDSCLLGIDQEVIGPIINTLKGKGVYDNTMIIVMGDHGETFGEHGIWGHVARLDYYEEPIHVPLLIKMPEPHQIRNDVGSLAQGIDILPTILDIAGIGRPHTAQGGNIIPLKEKKDFRVNEYVFGENRHYAYVRSKKWKLIVERSKKDTDIISIYHKNDRFFDLESDPSESKDVKDTAQDAYKMMKKELNDHLINLPVYVDRKYEFYPNIQEATREKIKQTGYW